MHKKIYSAMITCLVFFAPGMRSQTVCDSLSVDSVSLQSSNQFYFFIKNEGTYGCAYPSLVVTLNANPYLTAGTNPSFASWLDWAGGANNGMTAFIIPLTQFTPASSVPLNTVFTGTALLEDPNNPNFSCSLPFQFSYGTMGTSGAGDLGGGLMELNLFPNPVREESALQIKTITRGNARVDVLNVLGETMFSVEETLNGSNEVRLDGCERLAAGTYLVRVRVQGMEKSLLMIKQ